METVLIAVLATAVELLLLALIIAPRWTLRQIASLARKLLPRPTRPQHDAGSRPPAIERPR